ncbi:MAG TPA: carbamoyltransferase C-terminal domain-containing protein, partial [Rhodothermales bacterium]
LTMTSRHFHELFGGPPRQPESKITQREMDLAASVQVVTEEAMLRMARHVRRETGERNLCLAGGVALNCVANGKILREGIFDDIWIQPAAGDAGGALGAAMFVWHQVLEGERKREEGELEPALVEADERLGVDVTLSRTATTTVKTTVRDVQRGSYLGPAFDGAEIARWLDRKGYPYRRPLSRNGTASEPVLEEVAELLSQGKVVGCFMGAMEFGPRALGARSILGDARDAETQTTMNLKIKYRESFRPFAPSVLAEDVSEYFELDEPSPYMLLVAPVREERRLSPNGAANLFGIEKLKVPRSDIPAVTHVDYSARIQTVHAETHPRYHALIEAFKRRTGYGVIVNTSFNVRGEPIVCTPEDAYRCFMRTEMDALLLEDCLLLKQDQPEWKEEKDWRSEFALD